MQVIISMTMLTRSSERIFNPSRYTGKHVHHMSAQMNGNLFAQNLQRQIRLSLEAIRGHNMQRHILRTENLKPSDVQLSERLASVGIMGA